MVDSQPLLDRGPERSCCEGVSYDLPWSFLFQDYKWWAFCSSSVHNLAAEEAREASPQVNLECRLD
eukprot:4156667-Karenia_brevis.AAC.1